MSEGPPSHPVLFTTEVAGASPEQPALRGGKCRACGYVFFPMQTYGCERCGSEDLERAALAGRGKLVASAEVFMPAGPHRPAPFTVGSVTMDDGAVVRALLDVAAGTHLAPGTVMLACLVTETRPDRGLHDLRFVPDDAAET